MSSADKSSQFLTEFGSTNSSCSELDLLVLVTPDSGAPESFILPNDSTDTSTSLVLLFCNFSIPDINGSASLFFKFVTTWNGIVVGTETFIVLAIFTFIVFSVISLSESVALILAVYSPS